MKKDLLKEAKSLSTIFLLVVILLFSLLSSVESTVVYLTPISLTVFDREILQPDGSGGLAEWKPVPAMENWKCVNQAISDEDSSYVVATSTSVLTDLYSLQNNTVKEGKISSITVFIRCRASELLSGHSPPVSILVNTNSKEYESKQFALTTSYANYSQTYSLNPATGQVWTWKEIDDLQVGIRGNAISSMGLLSPMPSPTPSPSPTPTPTATVAPTAPPNRHGNPTPSVTPTPTTTPAPIQYSYPRCTQIWVQINYTT